MSLPQTPQHSRGPQTFGGPCWGDLKQSGQNPFSVFSREDWTVSMTTPAPPTRAELETDVSFARRYKRDDRGNDVAAHEQDRRVERRGECSAAQGVREVLTRCEGDHVGIAEERAGN